MPTSLVVCVGESHISRPPKTAGELLPENLLKTKGKKIDFRKKK